MAEKPNRASGGAQPNLPNIGLSDDRVIATPHIGGYTTESVSRATLAAVENLPEFFKV